jgi:2-succinyl-5-enolpyruvyl-6-hydroxy-3-cyclohexene-1-carboxylate synthase
MLSERLDYIAALFHEAGINNWFVAPGSRNAPIVAALSRSEAINLQSFPDERACAFAAMGFGLKNRYPAAFLCTSGSALANAYPAVLEAYYQRIPLLIVSADRPENRIDQWDGQTIRQAQFFGNYVRHSFHFDARSISQESLIEGVFSSIKGSLEGIPGPIHINIALSEPIYEGINSIFDPNQLASNTPQTPLNIPTFVHKGPSYPPVFPEDIREIINHKKTVLVIGMHTESTLLSEVFRKLQAFLPIFCDVSSGQTEYGLEAWDWGLFRREIPESLKPDVLITMGMGIVSKSLKQALTHWKPQHIHVGMHDEVGDPFMSQPQHWKAHEADFAEALYQIVSDTSSTTDSLQDENSAQTPDALENNKKNWESFIKEQTLSPLNLGSPFDSEFRFIKALFSRLTHVDRLHLGNSMTVRYGNWAGKTQARVCSNRGVSGIDGCLSTAVGDAIANPDNSVWVVLGDVSSVYDSNALWTDLPPNLTIVILNNSGGRIFDFINGPNELPAIRDYIHTPRTFDFGKLAAFYNVEYLKYSLDLLKTDISVIFKAKQKAVLIELVHETL